MCVCITFFTFDIESACLCSDTCRQKAATKTCTLIMKAGQIRTPPAVPPEAQAHKHQPTALNCQAQPAIGKWAKV